MAKIKYKVRMTNKRTFEKYGKDIDNQNWVGIIEVWVKAENAEKAIKKTQKDWGNDMVIYKVEPF